jgi:hypothetical protein
MTVQGRPLGPSRKPIRKDPAGWQIEDDESAERLLQGLEALGLILVEMVLKRFSRLGLNPTDHDLDLALRGLGHTAGSIGMTRLSWLTGTDEVGRRRTESAGTPEAEAIGEAMRRVAQWLLIWDPNDADSPPIFAPPSPPRPIVRLDLDELHAIALYLNRRASNQGTAGPGQRRKMVRTTSRRTSNGG